MNRKIRTWVEISLNDLEHNYREISSRLPDGCQMLGVCKANAYGHGAVRVAQRLQRAGCQWVAVNCYDEAEELRAAGVTMNILLLGPQSANIAVDLATLGVTQAVGSIEYARELNRFLAGTGLRLDAHMKLETGMGRTGFDVHDDSHLDEMIEALSLPHLNFTGVFTHFAVSDEYGDPYTQLQFSRFTHAIERMEQATGHHFAIRHCANSGAVINYPEMHLDMVRPGLLLYGVFPAKETGGLDLRPAMSLYSRVSEVTHHHAGDTISYGRTFTCPRDMRLAVLPVGYADGLLRSLSGKGDVLLHGKRAPQVGRICMDMCMVDVTDIPEVQPGDVATIFQIRDFEPNITISYGRTYTTEDPARIAVVGIGYADGFPRSLSSNVSFLLHGRRVPQVGRICMDMCMVDITRVPEAKVGDVVTVFGEDGGDSIELTSLANRLGTIPYELMCGINKRIPRIYLNGEDETEVLQYIV